MSGKDIKVEIQLHFAYLPMGISVEQNLVLSQGVKEGHAIKISK